MKAKVVIVGGGVMGLSIASWVARRTDPLAEPVLLLERDAPGAGASGRSSAVLRQFYGSRCTAGMARDSLRYYAGFENRTGRSIGFVRTGVLTLATSRAPEDVARLEELVEMQTAIGIEVAIVNAAEIRELVHGIEIEEGTFGAWECGGGCVDAERTLEAFTTIARNKGAVIRNGTRVEEVLVEGGRVRGVRTTDGVVECDQVVLAAGAWTKGLLDRLGLDYPLEATSTEHLFVCSKDPHLAQDAEPRFGMHGPEDSGATTWFSRDALQAAMKQPDFEGAEHDLAHGSGTRVSHPVLIDPEVGFYARCEPLHGRARVGRFSYDGNERVEDPDRFTADVAPGFQDWALDALARRIPGYADIRVLGAEAGLYTMTPDAQALVGPLPEVAGLFLVSGFSGHGFKLAPSVGEGVAQMLLGEPVSAFEPEFFAPARFRGIPPAPPPRPFGI